jgi:hypothetical protein
MWFLLLVLNGLDTAMDGIAHRISRELCRCFTVIYLSTYGDVVTI